MRDAVKSFNIRIKPQVCQQPSAPPSASQSSNASHLFAMIFFKATVVVALSLSSAAYKIPHPSTWSNITFPPDAWSNITFPPGALPNITFPLGAWPNITFPPGTWPNVTIPPGAWPNSTFPPGGWNHTIYLGPPLPKGYGPHPDPDTPEAFLKYEKFKAIAAAETAPEGFTRIFYNANAGIESPDYLTYHLLESYDAFTCAEYCDDTEHCNTFNLYFERNPTVDPNPWCENPPSTTSIKCALFSSPVLNANVSNAGQYRDDFHVVIAGSNGYLREPEVDVPGYSKQWFGNAAIGATVDCEGHFTYMGYKSYNPSTYSLARCAKACTDQNIYNVAHAPGNGTAVQFCHFVNSYIEKENGVATTQKCALYSKASNKKQATNYGQFRDGGKVRIARSIGLTNVTGNYDACVGAS
jgi:hypothetical protein